MQTHKNPTLRTGPAPFKTPTQFGSTSQAAGPVVKDRSSLCPRWQEMAD